MTDVEPKPDPAPKKDADDGGAGGDAGAGSPKTLTQSDVDRIVQDRVGQTKRQTEEAIAKQLGVSVDEAKRIIGEHAKASDKDKTDAQLAREKADREAAEAETAKGEAAQERHSAAIERQLIKALPRDLDDAQLDTKVARLARLLDVEVGADAETIKKAVDALKKEEPLMFGAPEGNGKKVPDSDPAGKPPVKKGSDDAFSRGAERAKSAAGIAQYPILQDK